MNTTLLYVGGAAAAYYFLIHKKREVAPSLSAAAPVAPAAGGLILGAGPAAVVSDSGGSVPASPETVERQIQQAQGRAAGLTQTSKNRRSVAAILATTGGRSLALGARKGVTVAAIQQTVASQVQKATATKPVAKKKGILGKVTGGVKSVGKSVVKVNVAATKKSLVVTKKGLDVAAKNPTLASAAAGAIGGPGAAAATRAGLAAYSNARSNGAGTTLKSAAVGAGAKYLASRQR